MISPTVGRVVWFYKYIAGQGFKGPMAGHVAFVHHNSMVNLMVIDENGVPRSETSVLLCQDDQSPPTGNYCTLDAVSERPSRQDGSLGSEVEIVILVAEPEKA